MTEFKVSPFSGVLSFTICFCFVAGVPNLAMVETVDDEKVKLIYLCITFGRMWF